MFSLRREFIRDVLYSGVPAMCFSGLPSTLWSLTADRSVLTSVWATGHLLAPGLPAGLKLFLLASVVHVAVSFFWTAILVLVLPSPTWFWGVIAGVLIAVVDLKLIGPCFPSISDLDFLPQLADHLAFGFIVGVVVYLRSSK